MANVSTTDLTPDVLDRAISANRLFVASDFDGVLSPIVADPQAARPLAGSIEALGTLSELSETTVSIVSGRERGWLQQAIPDPERFILVGSHGAEMGDHNGPSQEQQQDLDALNAALIELASSCEGLWVEPKALATAIHLRRADASCKEKATARVEHLVKQWPAKVVRGKEVVEFTTATATKGDAIALLRERLGPQVSIYFGDDVTDEDAFAVLGPDDISVKVGSGPTAARYRVDTPDQVCDMLRLVAQRRSQSDG